LKIENVSLIRSEALRTRNILDMSVLFDKIGMYFQSVFQVFKII